MGQPPVCSLVRASNKSAYLWPSRCAPAPRPLAMYPYRATSGGADAYGAGGSYSIEAEERPAPNIILTMYYVSERYADIGAINAWYPADAVSAQYVILLPRLAGIWQSHSARLVMPMEYALRTATKTSGFPMRSATRVDRKSRYISHHAQPFVMPILVARPLRWIFGRVPGYLASFSG